MERIDVREIFSVLRDLYFEKENEEITVEQLFCPAKKLYEQDYYNSRYYRSFNILDLLPVVKKYNVATESQIMDKIKDIKIKLSKDRRVNVYSNNQQTIIDEALKDLNNRLEKLSNDEDEETRNRLRNEIERLNDYPYSPKSRTIFYALGEYDHSSRMIILYVYNIEDYAYYNNVNFENMAISVLAHKLMHAFHANKTKTISKKWNSLPLSKCITIESLATYNELLVLEELGEDRFYKEEIKKLKKDPSPRVWPYYGVCGLLNFLKYLSDYYKEGKFIKQLLDSKLEYHDEELVRYTLYK